MTAMDKPIHVAFSQQILAKSSLIDVIFIPMFSYLPQIKQRMLVPTFFQVIIKYS